MCKSWNGNIGEIREWGDREIRVSQALSFPIKKEHKMDTNQ